MTVFLLSIALLGPVCDDGAPPYLSNGRPNFHCKIDGCGPSDPVCWPENLDGCYDETGNDTGTCSLASETCEGIIPCFGMWLSCYGEFDCVNPATLGCKEGTCTENEGEEAASASPFMCIDTTS